MNTAIQAAQVRLIGVDGKQLGIMSRDAALRIAQDQALDLVQMAGNQRIAVCRIMDYKKHAYTEKKKRSISRKKQHRIQVKEIKFRPSTESADYQIKLQRIRNFLGQGNKVKITLRYRGREMQHTEIGMKLMRQVESDLQEWGGVEQELNMDGRVLSMMFVPFKGKRQSGMNNDAKDKST